MTPGVFCSVWREHRYLPLVLEQMGKCHGPKLLIWMDKPWNWLGEGQAPSGWLSQVANVLYDQHVPMKDIVRYNPRTEEETLAFAQGHLAAQGAEVIVRMDSDTLFDTLEMQQFFDEIEDCTDPSVNVATNAIHYYRDFTVAHATTGLTLGYPILCDSILGSPHETVLKVDITAYHASYVKTDAEIYEKINSWSHAQAFKERGFYEKEWLTKDDSKMNLQRVQPPPKPILERLLIAGALLPWALGPDAPPFTTSALLGP